MYYSDYTSGPYAGESFEITATDPCDDEDALAYVDDEVSKLSSSGYDLFDGPDSYSFSASTIVTANGDNSAYITDDNCGAVVVSIAYSAGPAIFVEGTDTTYALWGADPSAIESSSTLTLQLTAYLTNYEDETTKTKSFDVAVTNTCATVTITAGAVYENGSETTEITYENGGESVGLTYDEFTTDISYCPLVYTVHLMSVADTPVEITWNRESSSATAPDSLTYPDLPDSYFSSNAKSSEYLTITRPVSGVGTIVIDNTGALDTYVGSYTLELRATH